MSNDQRKQPGAYVTDGKRLYLVLELTPSRNVRLEDCSSLTERVVAGHKVAFYPWRLIKHAPEVPDVYDPVV